MYQKLYLENEVVTVCLQFSARRESRQKNEEVWIVVMVVVVHLCGKLWGILFYNPGKVVEASIEKLSHPHCLIS